MEQIGNPIDTLSVKEKSELAASWRGKWLALVDDDTDDDEMLETLFPKIGLQVVSGSREQKSNPNSLVIQKFEDPNRFLESQRNSGSFDVCILDGRFNSPGLPTGPKLAHRLNQAFPQTLIIGRSAEDQYNDQFSRISGVVAVIPKSKDIVTAFPELLRSISYGQEDN